MPGPWEKYATPAAPATGPWSKYGAGSSAPAPSAPASDDEGFIHATLRKTADKMNVENLLGAISQADSAAGRGDYKGAWEAIKQLNPLNGVKAVANDVMHGNASDIASDVLPVAGLVDGLSGGRLSGAAVNTAENAAQATGKYAARVADNAPAVANAAGKVASAAGPKVGLGVAANLIPGIGHPISVGMLFHTAAQVAKGGSLSELGHAITGILKPTMAEQIEQINARQGRTQAAYASEPTPAPAAPVETAPRTASGRPLTSDEVAFQNAPRNAAQPLPTSKVQIPSKFSAESVTDTAGTSAPKQPAPVAPAATSAPALDAVTTKRIAEATQTGKLDALPPADKSALVKAVKAGDNEAVHSILDKHGAVDRTRQAVIDKVQVLAKYAQDHGIDLETIAPEDRQTLANAAWAHGSKNGLKVPKSGYRSISDDTYNMVRDKVAGK